MPGSSLFLSLLNMKAILRRARRHTITKVQQRTVSCCSALLSHAYHPRANPSGIPMVSIYRSVGEICILRIFSSKKKKKKVVPILEHTAGGTDTWKVMCKLWTRFSQNTSLFCLPCLHSQYLKRYLHNLGYVWTEIFLNLLCKGRSYSQTCPLFRTSSFGSVWQREWLWKYAGIGSP